MRPFLPVIALFVLLLAACQTNDSVPNTQGKTPPATAAAAVPTVAPTPVLALPAQNGTAVTHITLTPVITQGLRSPNYLTHAGDGRLFILEKPGRIRIYENGMLRPQPFLDIQEKVNDFINEQGLLGLAFHPEYQANGRFFIYYTTEGNSDTVLSEFRVSDNPNKADPASEQVLLTVSQPDSVHNGGQLAFGPDGYLYVGLGDGGLLYDRTGNGQNRETLLGSLLRLDVDDGRPYAIPPDNPFKNDPAARPEIWSYGWRNPWRFSFDRLTGDLLAGDVGEADREEINWQPAASKGGENYGWNIWEGTSCFQAEDCPTEGFVFPIFDYSHREGCAVVGGYTYRGEQFPELADNYFLGDYCLGTIWRLFPAGEEGWDALPVFDGDFLITSFGEDAAGELYVVTQNNGIWQIQP